MMDLKDIPICPDPDCPCCSLTRKIMETIEANGWGDMTERSISVAHVLARLAYGSMREAGFMGDSPHELYAQSLALDHLSLVVGKAVGRLKGHDTHGQTKQ